jgi:1,4-alpha-glucan branching enzyme
MTSYEGKYASVGVFGTFNDWCGTCNPMTDIDGDGVYTSTIEVIPGQFQYKFILDNQAVEESFEPGSPCTETTDIYTNRLLLVEGNMTAETVCFDSCVSCD